MKKHTLALSPLITNTSPAITSPSKSPSPPVRISDNCNGRRLN